ncbi:hypothetical protein [Saccharophagus degradans]|uniref:Uncharacterized protein n=1 Tax=Saccharophagus degradans (strain 2-40 / ATCC 43961 / DSM 17024) TaxID=203122 RepID=Q21DR0_SACD2|nr:hypothetical protein [Saccharophagus degradans]ABD83169.1 hypothetical protein Sde_3914 [Saccharophagus degradans 2-40]
MKPTILKWLARVKLPLIAVGLLAATLLSLNVTAGGEHSQTSTHNHAHTHTKPLGKPSQAVIVQGKSVINMAANSSQTITLKLKVKTKGVDTLSLVAKPDANLVVSLSEQPLAVPVNGHVEVPVTVQTGDNGRYYLMLQPTLHNQTGSLQANAVGVAIQVGPRQAQNKVSATADTAQEAAQPKVHSFTAQETVSEK